MGHERQPGLEPEYDPDDLTGTGSHDALPQDDVAPLEAGRRDRVLRDDLTGQTLDGRYRFDALLGEGTFARVYRVHDLARQVDLAAKVLRSDIAQEPAFLERFKREAAVLAQLQHPNIVRYYDIVESGRHVFIMTDYIAGDTLQWRMREQAAPIAPFDALSILRPLAAALHFAHQEGIVHRDLKPANILIAPNGTVYVTDFGIAKILTDTSTLTVDMTVGTPHYMSPEQILAAEVTPATDVYAFGVMLYQMFTGRLPFLGDSDAADGTTTAVRIAYEHLHVVPIAPTSINRRLSVAVGDVVLKCLEKDPAQRYPSVSALYDALAEAIGTPSVSLNSSVLNGLASGGQVTGPEAERVPTDVGGMSRVVEADEFTAQDAHAQEGRREYGPAKPKRKAKPDNSNQLDNALGEKGGEKQTEKQADYDEKEREKGPEKAQVWTFGGSGDRLSQITWGLIVTWAGTVFLLGFSNWWGWVLSGAGGLMIMEVIVRLISPQYRARPGARLVMGSVLLTIGLSMALAIGSFWPLVLIAVGISILINHMVGE